MEQGFAFAGLCLSFVLLVLEIRRQGGLEPRRLTLRLVLALGGLVLFGFAFAYYGGHLYQPDAYQP